MMRNQINFYSYIHQGGPKKPPPPYIILFIVLLYLFTITNNIPCKLKFSYIY